MNDGEGNGGVGSSVLDGKTVLVVEEDRTLRAIISRILTLVGATVSEAAEGPAALETLARVPHDVILTDVTMDGMDGFELLRAVRARDLDVAVILVTGLAIAPSSPECAGLGVFDCVYKPFRSGELRVAVGCAAAATRLARAKREAMVAIGRDAPDGSRACSLDLVLEHALKPLRK